MVLSEAPRRLSVLGLRRLRHVTARPLDKNWWAALVSQVLCLSGAPGPRAKVELETSWATKGVMEAGTQPLGRGGEFCLEMT